MQDRLLRRDHAAAQPARLRAAVPVAGAAGDIRRRRGERRGEPGAVRLRQPLRHAGARATRSATRRCARCAPRAWTSSTCCAAASRSASTSPRPARASGRRRHLRPRAIRRSARCQPGSVPWHDVFDGAAWFHWTGITPALGPSARECIARGDRSRPARRRAGQRRPQLPQEAVVRSATRSRRCARSMPLVDLVIANEEDLQAVLGIEVPHADVTGGSLDVDGYRAAAERVAAEFGVEQVAVTLRESLSASDNALERRALRRGGGALPRSQRYAVRLVDRIGGGDSFAAGLIFGLVMGADAERRCVRGGGERAEADHPGRLQSRVGRRSGAARRRRRQRTSAAVAARRRTGGCERVQEDCHEERRDCAAARSCALRLWRPTAGAQDYRGRVQGSVVDASQGALPGATVTLRNDATGGRGDRRGRQRRAATSSTSSSPACTRSWPSCRASSRPSSATCACSSAAT